MHCTLSLCVLLSNFVAVLAFTYMCMPLRKISPTLKGTATLHFQADNNIDINMYR